MKTDKERVDWLEMMANQEGGILLHDGSETGHLGIGLRPGSLNRTLREAIDQAMAYLNAQQEPSADTNKTA